ncbi:right-handed parallel beta-helix repeat-containing protein [Dyadobacter fanqingshengii]|uniref:Right-handed parallel beta-helix repeat-containing protein n=1 Tax=Dyadobacter fanqingshengii TaxID=2906443 RepID=A0A9X1PB44_9BACT|nr:right-handed parallel beta-helix repeat-containing protein [Dyadobacter fanqingshengii]MCF0042001.1 right-handed parallel beta-helix repeat-containing protein [Dyadobacter fanqingshengii]USJ36296.1 right-handed parallel beta-helix repeat-containing protein [Dyadobacter fanqingshengii]
MKDMVFKSITVHRSIAANFVLMVFLLFSFAASGKSFYFSMSSGNDSRSITNAQNPSTPWKTLKKLEENYVNMSPGDFVLFKKGDKWTGITLEPGANGIRFGSYGDGQLPIIDGFKNLALNINTTYQHDLIFDGLIFARSGSIDIVAQLGNAWSELHSGMTNSKVRNCNFLGGVVIQGSYNIFENNTVDGTTNDGNGNGIWEHHKYCHHNTYTGNKVRNFSVRGIWTMIETHDSVFENNVISDCKSAGIDLDGAFYLVYNHTVRNNRIFNIINDSIELENAFNCNVINNVMSNGGHAYIYIINYEKCKIVDGYGEENGIGAKLNSTISGNVMIGGGIDYSSVAIGIHKAGGVNVYNNSIYNFKSRFFDLDYEKPSEVQGIKLVNNIFSTINTPSWYGMINFSTDDMDLLEEDDYNCFYNQGRNDIYSNRGSHSQKSLAQYRQATGKGVHSISLNPLFANQNDLRLQKNSPCVDSGKMIGLPFKGISPDMGAYELSGDSLIPPSDTLDSIPDPGDALPVTLREFFAHAEGLNAFLAWSTVHEANASHFKVEHSIDTKSWADLGHVIAAGESASLRKYSFLHNNPSDGQNYYRLTMVDNDGSYSISQLRALQFDDKNSVIIFPNPASERIQLREASVNHAVKVCIYNQSGAILYESPTFPKDGVPVAKFIAGTYTLTLTRSNGVRSSYIFVKQ